MTSIYGGVDMDTDTVREYGSLLWRDAMDTAHIRDRMAASASLPSWVFGELPGSDELANNWGKFLDNRLEEGLTLATELGEHAGKMIQVAADHSEADQQAAQKIDGVINENSPNNGYQIPEVGKHGKPPSPDLTVNTDEYGPIGELVQPSLKHERSHVTRVPFPAPRPIDFLVGLPIGLSTLALHEWGTVTEMKASIPDFKVQSERDRLDQVMAEHGNLLCEAETIAKVYGADISETDSPLQSLIIPAWKSSPATIKKATESLSDFGGGDGYYQLLSNHYDIDTRTTTEAWRSLKGSSAWSAYALTTGEYIKTATQRVDGLIKYGNDVAERLQSIRDTCAAVVSDKAQKLQEAKNAVYKSLADGVAALSTDPVGSVTGILKETLVSITNEIQRGTQAELTASSETSALNAQINTNVSYDAALTDPAPFPKGDMSRSW